MENKKYTREDLLKIVNESLSNLKSRLSDMLLPTSPAGLFSGVLYQMDMNALNEEANRLKQEFIEAGLEDIFNDINKKYSNMQINSATNATYGSIQEYLLDAKKAPLDEATLLTRLAQIKSDFLKGIVKNVPETLEYRNDFDISDNLEFLQEYLCGFVYEPSYVSGLGLSELGMNMIEIIYSFYGLTLTEEKKEEIKKIHQNQKLLQVPKLLTDYISDDIKTHIISKMKLAPELEIDLYSEEDFKDNKNKNHEPTKNINEKTYDFDLDAKVEKIKEKFIQLEELAKEERQLLEALEANRKKQAALKSDIVGPKK